MPGHLELVDVPGVFWATIPPGDLALLFPGHGLHLIAIERGGDAAVTEEEADKPLICSLSGVRGSDCAERIDEKGVVAGATGRRRSHRHSRCSVERSSHQW